MPYLVVLSVSFRPVMRLAQHLAVADVCAAALAPCCYVVGIHFVKFINPGANVIMTFGTFRTITDSLFSCFICLTSIHSLLHSLFKDTDIRTRNNSECFMLCQSGFLPEPSAKVVNRVH